MTMIMENYKSSQHTGVVGKRKYNDGEDVTQPVTATSLKKIFCTKTETITFG